MYWEDLHLTEGFVMLQRFLLFAGMRYGSSGGWNDFVIHSNDISVLKGFVERADPPWDWAHIIDTTDLRDLIWSKSHRAWG